MFLFILYAYVYNMLHKPNIVLSMENNALARQTFRETDQTFLGISRVFSPFGSPQSAGKNAIVFWRICKTTPGRLSSRSRTQYSFFFDARRKKCSLFTFVQRCDSFINQHVKPSNVLRKHRFNYDLVNHKYSLFSLYEKTCNIAMGHNGTATYVSSIFATLI